MHNELNARTVTEHAEVQCCQEKKKIGRCAEVHKILPSTEFLTKGAELEYLPFLSLLQHLQYPSYLLGLKVSDNGRTFGVL